MATFWYAVLVALLVAYAVLDGFDLGVGALYLVVTRSDDDRRILLNAIGPVWDANEVWLIAVGLLPTSAEAPRATVAVRPEEHVVPVTVPFAQYVKLSEVALPVGVYVNVPFLQMPATVFCGCALQVSVPFSGAMRSVTP